jgi:hypothetical protein
MNRYTPEPIDSPGAPIYRQRSWVLKNLEALGYCAGMGGDMHDDLAERGLIITTYPETSQEYATLTRGGQAYLRWLERQGKITPDGVIIPMPSRWQRFRAWLRRILRW